jgi:hypothetical protein
LVSKPSKVLIIGSGPIIIGQAAEKHIPCFTSLDTARAAVEALLNGSQIYSAQPLPDYPRKEQS